MPRKFCPFYRSPPDACKHFLPCRGVGKPEAAAGNATTGTLSSSMCGSTDELLPIRMLDEDVSPRELVLAPSLSFSFLSRATTWQSRQDGEGQPLSREPRNKEGPQTAAHIPGQGWVPDGQKWGCK